LTSAAIGTSAANYKPLTHKQSLGLMFLFTFLGATAQMLMKTGVARPDPTLWSYLTNLPLIVGYSLYGLGAVLFTIALRDGELSVLYPVISLTYVWVSILSVPILHESFDIHTWRGASKAAGIVTIVAGVGVLGKGQKKA
jgi:drug/metabolite transporter (DMT)-like permease